MSRYDGLSDEPRRTRKTPGASLVNHRLSDVQTYNRDAIRTMLKGALEGKEDKVIKYAEKHGIPPAVFAAVIAHEADCGKSYAARHKNNFTGICGNGPPIKFSSVDAGLDAGAKLLAKYIDNGRDTIAKIQPKYAPTKNATNDKLGLNKYWQNGVAGYLAKFMNGDDRMDPKSTMIAEAPIPATKDRDHRRPVVNQHNNNFDQVAALTDPMPRHGSGAGERAHDHAAPRVRRGGGGHESDFAVVATRYHPLPGLRFSPFGIFS